jgi:hypothetical protein
MANTITIAGKHVNKWFVYGGIGGVVIVGVLYFKNKNSSSSSGSSTQDAIDPVTGLPFSQDNQVDPATGMTYLAEAEQYGSVSSAETAVQAGFGSGGGSGGVSGVSGDAFGFPAGSSSGTSVVAITNADWAQEVISALPGVTGDSQSNVATAVANYLAGLPLTSTQANDIQVALAEFGPPPTGSFSIITQGSGGGPTGTGNPPPSGGGGGGGVPPAPTVIKVAPTGFRVVSVTNHDNVNLAWNAVPGASGYVIAYGPTSGSQKYKQGVGGGNTTAATVAGVGAGSAGKHYFELWATPAATGGPHAGPVEATTTKS